MNDKKSAQKVTAALVICAVVFLSGISIYVVKENMKIRDENHLAEITRTEAVAIAVSYVRGAEESNITKCRKYRSRGKSRYYVEIYYKKDRYEFRIDAKTGNVLNKNFKKQ